ncbi:MAG: M13 family metallopeptidase [Thermoplasmataceae archaeon]
MGTEYNTQNDVKINTERRFSTENIDNSFDPLTDFYNYANGNWLKNNDIPDDKPAWGSFDELSERNLGKLHDIVLECAGNSQSMDDNARKICGLYKSVMNTELIEGKKLSPIEGVLKEISEISSKDSIYEKVVDLSKNGISTFFSMSSNSDKKDSSIYAFYFEQGGLSLPNRDHYINESNKSILDEFSKFVEKMFLLAGLNNYDRKTVEKIISMEKRIAEASRSNEDLRDEERNYNRVERHNIPKVFNFFNLGDLMQQLSVPETPYVIIGQPEFFKSLTEILENTDLETIKAYLALKVIISAAPFLNSEMELESFNFYGKKLMGLKEPELRWKKAVKLINSCMGEALGKIYVEKFFPEESKRKVEEIVNDIKSVFKEKLEHLDWMGESTKKLALKKFAVFRTKIGYPAKFRDYSLLSIDPNDLFGNVQRAIQFEINRTFRRVGNRVDKEEWEMPPPTVNAYFSPTDNEIVFPAGILQPPFFDPGMDEAVNYGAIGGVISHEITHGYDDQGRMYDSEGNISEWWAEKDKTEFNNRAKKVIDLYSSKEILPGVFVHGDRTVGENIADFGGVSIAFAALERHLNQNRNKRQEIDGFDPEQRFFLSWAQIWAEKIRPEYLKLLVTVDPHAPNELRGALPVYNHEGFFSAFKNLSKQQVDVNHENISIW